MSTKDVLGMEIDRKLFMMCRLCLEDDGVYQIDPKVQEQINYCFGIIVEHFDGLPQLLCKKCKLLLNDYSFHKKIFIDKQETLKKKLEDKFKEDETTIEKGKSNNEQTQECDFSDITSNSDNTSSNFPSKNKRRRDKTTLSGSINAKRKRRLISSSSTESADSMRLTKKKTKLKSNNNNSKLPTNWQKKYMRHYKCRLCSISFETKRSILNHFNNTHLHIKSRHQKILETKCTVNLNKLDNKPNITGLTNTVVFSKDKIVQDEGDKLFYLIYTPRDTLQQNFSDSSDEDFYSNRQRKRLRLNSRTSTDTLVIGNNNSAKLFDENIGQNLLKSDTKVDSNKQPEAKDTICIDDSSDSDIDLKSHLLKFNNKSNAANNDNSSSVNATKTEEIDNNEKIINEIISVCRKKYEARRKAQSNEATTVVESKLKNKILSVGLKIIGKRMGSYNCTGLLRYIEHKNLNVVWDEKSQIMASLKSKEGDLVKMLIKKTKRSAVNEESAWIDVETDQPKGTINNNNRNTISINSVWSLQNSDLQAQVMKESQNVQQPQVSPNSQQPQISLQPQTDMPSQSVQQPQLFVHQPQIVIQPPHHEQNSQMLPSVVVSQSQLVMQPQVVQHTQIVQLQNIVQQSPIMQQPQFVNQPLIIQQQQGMDQAILYGNVIDDSHTKKLLNPNPVANPKQLPKKIYSNDTKAVLVNNRSNESVVVGSSEQISEENMIMPVITSTTSLAEPKNNDDKAKSDIVVNNADKPAPRIKVKPVSELMKPSSMMNMAVNQPNSIWSFKKNYYEQVSLENSVNIYVPNNLVSQIHSQSSPLPSASMSDVSLISNEDTTSEVKKSSTDSIILDTVDFPNARTDSPFKYFRNLLLIHDIILTEANANLSRDFVCLLKFKVQFKQENKNLTLCLSLFCSDNKFCMSVKDGSSINIHMGKMSANWQWEIMKVFQGDVTNKILQNAQKVGQNVYTKTKSFLCLLQSIKQK